MTEQRWHPCASHGSQRHMTIINSYILWNSFGIFKQRGHISTVFNSTACQDQNIIIYNHLTQTTSTLATTLSALCRHSQLRRLGKFRLMNKTISAHFLRYYSSGPKRILMRFAPEKSCVGAAFACITHEEAHTANWAAPADYYLNSIAVLCRLLFSFLSLFPSIWWSENATLLYLCVYIFRLNYIRIQTHHPPHPRRRRLSTDAGPSSSPLSLSIVFFCIILFGIVLWTSISTLSGNSHTWAWASPVFLFSGISHANYLFICARWLQRIG